MPNVIGQNYDEAVQTLTDAGVYVVYPAYAFLSPPQITVEWDSVPGADGLVVSQSPSSGATVAAGVAITLTVGAFPMSAVIS